jgi:hypothetical protein
MTVSSKRTRRVGGRHPCMPSPRQECVVTTHYYGTVGMQHGQHGWCLNSNLDEGQVKTIPDMTQQLQRFSLRPQLCRGGRCHSSPPACGDSSDAHGPTTTHCPTASGSTAAPRSCKLAPLTANGAASVSLALSTQPLIGAQLLANHATLCRSSKARHASIGKTPCRWQAAHVSRIQSLQRLRQAGAG